MPLSVDEHERLRRLYIDRVAGLPGVTDDYMQRWRAWCRTLLSYGGELVVPAGIPEPDLEQLSLSSTVFEPAVRFSIGDDNGCHANVARLWIDGSVEGIGTGYALSDDDLWRQHSWGVDPDGTVVETTSGRVSYVGVVLGERSSLEYAMGNAPQHLKATMKAREPRGVELISILRRVWPTRHSSA